MKVLLINGSPKNNGNTFYALSEVAKSLNEENIETEIIHIGANIKTYMDCGACIKLNKCVIDDI